MLLEEPKEATISLVTDRRFHEIYPATSFLLLFIVAFFLLEIIQSVKVAGEISDSLLTAGVDPTAVHILGSVSRSDLERGQYWRLIAAAFLHGGVLHLLFNGLMLVDLGRYCEPLLSSWKFVVVYGASALLGSLLHCLATPAPMVGASGALCGLFGLLLVYSIRERHPELRDGLVRSILVIALMSYALPNVAHFAHLGGFLAGGALGFTVRDYIASRAAERWRYPGYVVAAIGVACLGFALWNYFAYR